jgi:hypothetical protein
LKINPKTDSFSTDVEINNMTEMKKQCEILDGSDEGSALPRGKEAGFVKRNVARIALTISTLALPACLPQDDVEMENPTSTSVVSGEDGGKEGAGGSESVGENSELGDRAVYLASNLKKWGFEGRYTSSFYLIVSLDGKPAFSTIVDKDDYGNDGRFRFVGPLNGTCLMEVNAFKIAPDGGPGDEIPIDPNPQNKEGMYGNPRLELLESDCERE